MNDPFSSRCSTDPIKQSFDALVKDDLVWIFRELPAPITGDCIMAQSVFDINVKREGRKKNDLLNGHFA